MKYQNLLKLQEGGIPVPRFFALPWTILNLDPEWMREAGPRPGKTVGEEDRTRWLEDLRALLTRSLDASRDRISAEIESRLSGQTWAVRSSSKLEDSAEDSFAGLFQSYLHVEKKDLLDRVADCFLSLLDERVLEYCLLREIPFEELTMDVIIQEMVEADYSGILFSQNPQGILSEMVISYGRGAGEGIVSDRSDSLTLYYHIDDREFFFGPGRIPPSWSEEDLLSEEVLQQLVGLAGKIERIMGRPGQDIEFSLQGGELFILQSRPISSLKGREILLFDNSNLVESYPGLTLPLSVSFAKLAYTGVFTALARRIWKNRSMIEDHREILENMVAPINGAMYYRLDNWYRLLQLLPFSKRIIPLWQEMLGVETRDYPESDLSLPIFFRLKMQVRLIRTFFSIPGQVSGFIDQCEEIDRSFQEGFREEPSNEDLLKLFDLLREKVLAFWDITLLNDLYAFVYTGLAKRKAGSEDSKREISGIQTMESMKPLRALIDLVETYLLKRDIQDLAYLSARNRYIERYGDRTLEELKLETESFRTDSGLLDRQVIGMAADPERLEAMKDIFRSRETAFRTLATKRGFFAKRAIRGIENRELFRLRRTWVYGMARSIFRKIADRLVGEGKLADPEDIFYLEIDEISLLVKDDLDRAETARRISRRRSLYRAYAGYPVVSRHQMFPEAVASFIRYRLPETGEEGAWLKGVASSSGRVRARAVVINDPRLDLEVRGQIIVTEMTDPGWVFLLASAKGIIAERGSLLSHTAIISRELKIPAIVAVDKATRKIRTGDLLEMDGATGEIRKIEE